MPPKKLKCCGDQHYLMSVLQSSLLMLCVQLQAKELDDRKYNVWKLTY